MGVNNSKKKGAKPEFARFESVMAKIDHRAMVERQANKRHASNRERNKGKSGR